MTDPRPTTDPIDKNAQFNREQMPERVVHVRDGGAFGVFEVTPDLGGA